MNTYVYLPWNHEMGVATVGFYDPAGKWIPESDYPSDEEAAQRVHWLNGGHVLEDIASRLAKLEATQTP